ncbi:MAG: hypothetical protein CVV61_05100 [Tenericutes bacterium HGW-Tenericutes-6]|jgi:hypothetical protein|nr:MAG: hypothetical protein CVV61_05100 [Tenericutes bacterium HGW-Tenericutes-6]
MRFDTWDKEQKKSLELEYQKRFGGQVRMIKKLYKDGSDHILLKDLLDNVSRHLQQAFLSLDKEQFEALVERMFLSAIPYDFYVDYDFFMNEHTATIIFYNDFDSMEFSDIPMRSLSDIQNMLDMILYISKNYESIISQDQDAAKNLDEYNFLEGFNMDLEEFKEDGTSFRRLKN